MEVRSDLATGHARTANARTRMRSGWMEIATVLNSVGDGCIKDWKQWAKYWKDKKASTKRKANNAETARRRTGGGVDAEVVELTELEQKILTISGGLSYATGDTNLAINPFPEHESQPVQPPLCSETNESESILRQLNDVPEQSVTILDARNIQWEGTAAAVVGDTVAENLTPSVDTPDVTMGVIEDVFTLHGVEMAEAVRNVEVAEEMPAAGQNDGVSARRRIWFDSPSRRRGSSTPAAAQRPSTAAQHHRRTALTSPRAGARPVRRRPLQRSPPSQRRSEMASLTERFIAIEEQRAEAELARARAMEANSQGPKILAEALDRFANAITQCVEKVLCNRPQNTST